MAIKSIGLIEPVWQFVDETGVPYAGGSLTFVQVGTSTAQNVYSDPALTSSLGNVVTLNAAGRTSTSSVGPDTAVYFQQLTYDYTLKNAGGTTIYGPITFSGSQWPGQIQGQAELSPLANANGYANRFTTTINKASSGTHSLFAGTRFDIPTIGAGASTLTEAATVYIEGPPATGTTPYALHVDAGNVQFDGNLNVTGAFITGGGVVALADGATPALDASLGSLFTLVTTTNPTIAVPTNPTSGQKIIIRVTASGGARTMSLNTGAGGFRFGTDITALSQTSSGKTDYVGCIYDAVSSTWDVVGYRKGY